MKQVWVEQAIEQVKSIALDPLLDHRGFGKLGVAVSALLASLQAVESDLKSRAASQLRRDHSGGGAEGRGGFFFRPSAEAGEKESVAYIDKAELVLAKYCSLDAEVKTQPYYLPVPAFSHEPGDEAQRFEWYRRMQLSNNIAVVKFNAGGAVGNISFVIRRRDDLKVEDDLDEVDKARKAAASLLPRFHGRATVKFVQKKIELLAKMSKASARQLAMELLGTDSRPETKNQAEMDAYAEDFATTVGDPAVIRDIRTISNGLRTGSTVFVACFKCVEELLASKNLAAQERREAGVHAYMSEFVSFEDMYAESVENFEQKKVDGKVKPEEEACSIRWLKFNFWPANQHVRTAGSYTGRFQVVHALQTRTLHKNHPHTYYAITQRKHGESYVRKFIDYFVYVQLDGKVAGNFGEPDYDGTGNGFAVSFLQKQRSVPVVVNLGGSSSSSGGSGGGVTREVPQAADHDCGASKTGAIPTVTMVVGITADPNASLYTGKVFVTLKNKTLEPSTAFGALAELEATIIRGAVFSGKTALYNHCDGGGEHHVGHPTVIAAHISLFLRNRHILDKVTVYPTGRISSNQPKLDNRPVILLKSNLP